jgi:hypothetical protein
MSAKKDNRRELPVLVTARELSHVLAGLRLLQSVGQHSADLEDVATNGGAHRRMAPREIDRLCERLNLGSRTVSVVMQGLPSMVVLNDGETWTALDDVELVFLPADADDDVMGMYDNGEDADHIVPEVEFRPPTGVFDLDRLVRDLPMEVLEAHRLLAGKKPEGSR